VPAERARRTLPLVLAWMAAAAVAVAVASWGVALVGRSVTEDRPAALASAEVEERLSEVAATASTTSSTSSTSPPAGETTTSTGPTTTVPRPSPPTTVAPAPTPAPTTVAPAPAPAAETRTYTLVGGTASLRFEPSGVTVVFANPAQGFDVEFEPEHGNGVRVEFESGAHESRLDGWWDGGPRERKEERPDDG
jgi:cytoskeletal protein RodZ